MRVASVDSVALASADAAKQRRRMRRYFWAAGSSLLTIGILFVIQMQGALSEAAFIQVACAVLVAVLAFYLAFRTGLNLRFADPGLTLPQMSTAIMVMLYAMYLSNGARGVFLIFVLMAFVCGVLSVSARALMRQALFILVGYGLVIGLLWVRKPQTLDLSLEVLQWLALAITLPWFARMGGYTSSLQERLKRSNLEQRVALETVRANERNLLLARDETAAAQNMLIDAIESLTDSFAVFDAGDRLILCNCQYARTFTNFDTAAAVVGMSYEDLVRTSVSKGEVIEPEFKNDVEAWVAERVRHHRNPGTEPREIQLGDGRWMQVIERRTQSGGVVGVRRDITRRKRLEQRQAMEHAVTHILAEAGVIGDAAPRIIQTVCQSLQWDCGARWYWDEKTHHLRCAETWGMASGEITAFLAGSSDLILAPESAGLVRRAWTSLKPLWIADVSCEPGFNRAALASMAGLRSAFAFPIVRGEGPAGVMEFYTRDARPPDAALLAVAESIGLQIGQFLTHKEAEKQLRHLAHFDLLTALPNRNLFNHSVVRALAKARRRQTVVALLFIDLDGFKQINDTFGHDAGDYLLQTFAQRLRECVRATDAIGREIGNDGAARVGGDEFMVLIEDVPDLHDLVNIARRILDAAAEPFDLAGPKGRVTASIGISVYPSDGADVMVLTKNADTAMYSAKQSGKNKYHFFSTAPGEASTAEEAPVLSHA
ncbi:MAG: diguanylate cyclase [Betaproteobacteria bacterium]